jgi:hypothetical protein
VNAQLTIGCLTECPRCGRKKLEPGAKRCPDCQAIARMLNRCGEELAELYAQWRPGSPWRHRHRRGPKLDPPLPLEPSPHLAEAMQEHAFGSLEDLLFAYDRWLM